MKKNTNQKKSPQHLQPIYDIAEICAQKGVTNAILCPGSRCAPLTLAFARNTKIKTWAISDERSAGFLACGMSLNSNTPTVLVCTSGSAVYHFAPAVVESFFQHIPIIIITADRPREWVDQWDGQTIHQYNIYGKHVKTSYELHQDYKHPDTKWHTNRIINEAINLTNQHPKGPVHINIPLREPLYPHQPIRFSKNIRIIEKKETIKRLSSKNLSVLQHKILEYKKVLMIIGQSPPNTKLTQQLERLSHTYGIPVIVDITSNQHGMQQRIAHANLILEQANTTTKKTLRPELLITLGKSILSKEIKHFIRQYKPTNHWHIQNNDIVRDPYQVLTQIIPVDPLPFCQQLNASTPQPGYRKNRANYCNLWITKERKVVSAVHSFFEHTAPSELYFFNKIIQALPRTCSLHLSNSLPIRYANFIGLRSQQHHVKVLANRGVSGIDGCTSVAVGHVLINKEMNVLITGDVAFFHDRNAFWHNYPLPNLRVVVLNNHGGAIFSIIEGPSQQPECTPYFVTEQKLTAKNLASEYGFEYTNTHSTNIRKNILENFFKPDKKTKILEIETDTHSVKETMIRFKAHIKKWMKMSPR